MDIIQARKHLKEHEAELKKYQSLNRSLMGYEDIIHVDKKITYFKNCIKNIRRNFNMSNK